MEREDKIKIRYEAIVVELNERQRRLWAAAEAKALGYGGITQVAKSTGMSIRAIRVGLKELATSKEQRVEANRVRKEGGGRKCLAEKDPTVLQDLEKLVEANTCGDPQSSLRWTSKSTRKLATKLKHLGHKISHQTVALMLEKLDYSLQGNKKAIEGGKHPDRDAQFAYINQRTQKFKELGQPTISVDAKKKS